MTVSSLLRGSVALGALLGLAACGGSSAPPPVATPAVVQPVTPPAAPNVADLQGARASSGESEMQQRGFAVARQRGLTAYWWHAASGTCVRTVTSNGRYSTVNGVAAPNCGH
ncbi:hypothetical protein KPL78_05445 [Roseomonas sp. HJA6]|uniref:Lipoprotein n=1 Tax=Roseomonas alba TaxID=2846776 RepID=A0ABS7A513_9PROT|nr:hypothetical protein [Neoroseomonas alba]MBW6397283.1 hypothetical protein [Neoroseomonas alba]